ncbi:MAG: SPOR domain-containing protein [Gammaproteobacteria bacterium]|nr:SPOR domain-containing protein [Gammaproteobacteria bacterium]MCZ6578579.1 SPOR domain-containing protein [Gammaproteobacteria bacterium]MCZ6667186.1 SPOR domain-containing protein [Gammaproteobacteria bacterium]MCZ6796846.1 SPOR domain-containing protein [Gammaproteobacteria bacterium]
MDQNTKQRLVGIAVIFALAVIFLPMILDGSGVRDKTLEVVIPPQPVSKLNPEFDAKIIELHSKVEELPDLEPQTADESSTGASNRITRSESQESNQTTVAQKTDRVAADESVPKVETSQVGGDTWVLQVASFKDKPNALIQRDKLRKSNISAVFVEQFYLDEQVIYRVRLGPFLNRDTAKIALNKIKAKYDLDGLIMKYEK